MYLLSGKDVRITTSYVENVEECDAGVLLVWGRNKIMF